MDRKDFEALLNKYPDCVSDGKKLKAFLKDLYPDVPKAIVNTLTIMADDGIIAEIQMSAESSTLVAARLQKKLEVDYGLSQKIISDCFSLIAHKRAESTQVTPNLAFNPNDFVIKNGVLEEYKGSSSVVVIPDGVTSIGESAFSGCTGLKSIVITDSVTSIGDHAFRDCKGLTSVTIPDSVTSIGDCAFCGCSRLTSVTIGNGVTSIGRWAFSDCGVLMRVTIPGSVTSIGDCAFLNCRCLMSVTIPDSVTSIGKGTFAGCSVLTSVTIPNSVTSIGDYAFQDCMSLTSITIPDSVTSIGKGAFDGCSVLTSVTIPDGVASIGDCAFYDTPWYNKQPNGLVYAGKVAYRYKGFMNRNTSITLREDTLGIASYAFYECSGLTSITIGNSVTSIGKYAFEDCYELQNIYITDIAAWCNISGLGNLMDNGSSNNNLYINNKLVTSVTIPDGVTSIPNYAFHYCSSLTSIEIPDCVTSIGEYAFAWCRDLTSITIPVSVVDIGDSAFAGCHNLTIYCEAEKLPESWTNVNWNPDNRPVVWGVKKDKACR